MNDRDKPQATIGSFKVRHFSVASHKLLKKLKNPFVILAILLVIIGAGIGVFYLSKAHTKTVEKKAFTKAADRSGQLQQLSKNTEAKQVLEDYLATKPSNKENRGKAEYSLAQISLSLSDYAKARSYAEQSLQDTGTPTYQMYLFLGNVTKVQKDTAASIGYFQKAIDIIEAKKTKSNHEIAILSFARSNISDMKGNSKAFHP